MYSSCPLSGNRSPPCTPNLTPQEVHVFAMFQYHGDKNKGMCKCLDRPAEVQLVDFQTADPVRKCKGLSACLVESLQC